VFQAGCYPVPVRKAVLSRVKWGFHAGLLLWLAFLAPALAASGDWFARAWQTEDGLPDNNVTSVVQSPDGYLWVGTLAGLMRFDGVRFQEFSALNLEGVPSGGVRKLLLDRKNRLWLAMDRGIVVCVETNTARLFTSKEGLPGANPQMMAEDPDGAIWMAYGLRATLIRIKDDKVTVLGAKEGVPSGMPALVMDVKGQLWLGKGKSVGLIREGRFEPRLTTPDSVTEMAQASGGGVWVCTASRLLKVDDKASVAEEIDRLPPGTVATALMEDRDGILWLGSAANGLFRRGESGFETISTSHREISCLMQEREGNIWAGTIGGGLNRVRPRAVELLGIESGLPFESVRSVCEDATSIWVATQNGVLARREGTEWTIMSGATNWPGGNAACVASDATGAVWIGTSDHGLTRYQNGRYRNWRRRSGLASDSIRALLVSSQNDVWFASGTRIQRMRDGAVKNFPLPEPIRYIRAMTEDAAGNIWIGSSEGHLFRIYGDETVNETLRLQGQIMSIRCLYASSDGALWIGYAGSGLGRFKDGKYTRITTARGLYDDFISQIVADKTGRLWLAGNIGIFQVSMKELADVAEGRASSVRSIIYGRGEGLPSLQAHYDTCPGSMRSRDGRIWVATRAGLAVIHTENIRNNPDPPPVYVERAAVDGRTAGLYDSVSALRGPEARNLSDLRSVKPALSLEPHHRKLEIEFTALSFSAPENVHFRYRLEGLEDEWVEAHTQRAASYSRLGAGNYRFRVMACNNDGVWNEAGAVLSIVVLPFFWQTWTFRIAALATFTLSLIAIVRYVSFRRLHRRLRTLEQQAALHNERARIAKDIHDDLGATLTQIALLGELAKQDMAVPEKASEHVQKISNGARQVMKSLDEIVWAVNPRNDTLPHLIDYIGQFTFDFLRMPGIRCRLDLPEQPPAINLPADVRHNVFLAVKEALNNIVKHANASEVWLRVDVANGALRVVVEDNGQGFERPPQDAWADGLRNMRQRLAEIGGECRIESRAGTGTTITFEVPWQRN